MLARVVELARTIRQGLYLFPPLSLSAEIEKTISQNLSKAKEHKIYLTTLLLVVSKIIITFYEKIFTYISKALYCLCNRENYGRKQNCSVKAEDQQSKIYILFNIVRQYFWVFQMLRVSTIDGRIN